VLAGTCATLAVALVVGVVLLLAPRGAAPRSTADHAPSGRSSGPTAATPAGTGVPEPTRTKAASRSGGHGPAVTTAFPSTTTPPTPSSTGSSPLAVPSEVSVSKPPAPKVTAPSPVRSATSAAPTCRVRGATPSPGPKPPPCPKTDGQN
jgi:hypothetical protein